MLPTCKHLLSFFNAVAGEIVHSSLRVGLHQLHSTLFYCGLDCEIRHLQRVAHLLQRGEHLAVARIYHVAHPVAHPEGVLVGEGHGVCTWRVIALGLFGSAAIDRCVGHHIAVVVAEPNDATHFARHPCTELTYIGESRLLRRGGTLVEIFFAIVLKLQRRGAVRHLPDALSQVFVEREWSSLVVVAHASLYVLKRHLAVGHNPEGHRLSVFLDAGCKVEPRHHVIEMVEEAPHTSLTGTTTTEVRSGKHVAERELGIFSSEPTHLAGILNHCL